MRKLTVKNFSVIKEAELEFGKITVLIGPQSSGKSLLCKLAFFFEQRVPEIIQDVLRNERRSYEHLLLSIQSDFLGKFPPASWEGQKFSISYDTVEYLLTAEAHESQTLPQFGFKRTFQSDYPAFSDYVTSGSLPQPQSLKRVMTLNRQKQIEAPRPPGSVYIPTARSFYSLPNKGFLALSTKNLDWITQLYATEFDQTYKALLDSYRLESSLLSEFAELATSILKGKVVPEGGTLVFESADDSRKRPFEILSSGTLELLPLVDGLSKLAVSAQRNEGSALPEPPYGTVYIEEPELSVFPSTQYSMVKLVAWLASRKSLEMSYTITTHSPYILSAFNNLIYAGQLGKDKAIRRKIPIDNKYWIEPRTFAAYSIHDGKLESILSKSGLIDGEYLDSVSEKIGNEFDSLLRLEYDKTKAS